MKPTSPLISLPVRAAPDSPLLFPSVHDRNSRAVWPHEDGDGAEQHAELGVQWDDESVLKAHFIEALSAAAEAGSSLRTIVIALLTLGVTRDEMVDWGVAAGYRENYVRSLLSHLLCANGLRRRRKGAGPTTPQEALALLALARELYGERAEKLLRAAAHAAKNGTTSHVELSGMYYI